MADELTATARIQYAKGNELADWKATITATVTGTGYVDEVVTIGTTDETLAFGDIGSANIGWYQITNLDATNYVLVGFDGSTYPHKLTDGTTTAKGGHVQGFNNGATIHAKANSASCKIQVRGVIL